MAAKQCVQCGRFLKKDATECPRCGTPIGVKETKVYDNLTDMVRDVVDITAVAQTREIPKGNYTPYQPTVSEVPQMIQMKEIIPVKVEQPGKLVHLICQELGFEKAAKRSKINEEEVAQKLAKVIQIKDHLVTPGPKGVTNKQLIPAIKAAVDAKDEFRLIQLKDRYPNIFKSSVKYIGEKRQHQLEELAVIS